MPQGNGEGVYSNQFEPPVATGQCAEVHWVMVYFHKTQSFMKNGGQQVLG